MILSVSPLIHNIEKDKYFSIGGFEGKYKFIIIGKLLGAVKNKGNTYKYTFLPYYIDNDIENG